MNCIAVQNERAIYIQREEKRKNETAKNSRDQLLILNVFQSWVALTCVSG